MNEQKVIIFLISKKVMSGEAPILKDCIPKKTTQQEEFLQKYPEYDGSGILMAIIDIGFDISMPALQKTTTNLPKIIDCYDFTGEGNVDTSFIGELDVENILIGRYGRKIKIPSTWINPSGKWHLGLNCFPELGVSEKNLCQNGTVDIEKLTEQIKQDLKFGENVIHKYGIVDCIVWNDGEKWRACIDIFGDLEKSKFLTNYRDEHEYAFINKRSFCVNICKNGNLLEIFYSAGDHGTIVSNVAAGHFPDESYPDGLAPGAQIILMKTFNAFHIDKAILKCIELKVDIINISMIFLSHKWMKFDIIHEAVQKHGIIIFKAVSNEGPIYSSIITDYRFQIYNEMFIIGGVMPHEIKCKFFDIKEEKYPTRLALCSRGPSITGERVIDFMAPGAVVLKHKYRCPSTNKLFMGSSFSCPNAAGSVACLLSALKANSIKYNPQILKFALANTAYLPDEEDGIGFGNGIIQINSAFEYFKSFSHILSSINFPKLSFLKFNPKQTGIFLIQKHNEKVLKTYPLKINTNAESTWILKIAASDGDKSFIEYPDTVTNGSFNVTINPESLNPGTMNYAELHVFDPLNLPIGPLFKFPITAIIAKQITKSDNNIFQKEITLIDEIPFTFFLHSPFERSKCTVKITSLKGATSFICFQYAIGNGEINQKQYFYLTFENQSTSISIPSKLNDQLFQISICQFHDFQKPLKDFELNLEITFKPESQAMIQSKKKTKTKKNKFF